MWSSVASTLFVKKTVFFLTKLCCHLVKGLLTISVRAYICILVFVFFAMSHGLWYLSSLTMDQTHTPAVKAPSANHQTAREFPGFSILFCSSLMPACSRLLLLMISLLIFSICSSISFSILCLPGNLSISFICFVSIQLFIVFPYNPFHFFKFCKCLFSLACLAKDLPILLIFSRKQLPVYWFFFFFLLFFYLLKKQPEENKTCLLSTEDLLAYRGRTPTNTEPKDTTLKMAALNFF